MSRKNTPLPGRAAFGPGASAIYGVVTAALFLASSSAPTPVYHLYQELFGLSPAVLTVIFAAYAFSLLAALLTIGSLSDYVGRRPVILAALILNLLAMAVFATANSAGALILARVIQGFAAGAATTTLGAAILDFDKTRGPLLNSAAPFLGMTVGSLLSGVLVTVAPAPTQIVYILLFAVTMLMLALLYWVPESASGRPGALASLRPHVSIPPQTRGLMARITPVNVAAWALGGFYLSLMPSLVRVATGLNSPIVGAIVVAVLTLTATVTVVVLRDKSGLLLLTSGCWSLIAGVAVTLAGVYLHMAALMIVGAVFTGIAFGACFSGALRTVLPLAHPHERAGLLAAFFVQSYLAFSLPAIAVGLVAPRLGLSVSAYVYGGIVMALATLSLIATRQRKALPG
jgi:predicted MFS family arabinose efflux permease